MKGCLFLFFLSLASCTPQLAFHRDDVKNLEIVFQDLQTEVADVKHALNNVQVELQLMDERLKQDITQHNKATVQQQLGSQLATMEKRLYQLEKTEEKTLKDLHQFSSHTQQTSLALTQYKEKIAELQRLIDNQAERLDEVVQLKSTLNSISKAMQQAPEGSTSAKTYRVKSGDSLEKIARKHQTTVEELKKLNRLGNDKIVIGQDLKVGY